MVRILCSTVGIGEELSKECVSALSSQKSIVSVTTSEFIVSVATVDPVVASLSKTEINSFEQSDDVVACRPAEIVAARCSNDFRHSQTPAVDGMKS